MNRSSLTTAIVLIAFALLTNARVSAEPEPDEIVQYKKIGKAELHLHVFHPDDHNKHDRTPAIVFFFGGGWTNGTPEHFYRQSQYLASRGMVAICADYRVKNRHGQIDHPEGTTPEDSPKKAVKDGKSAIRWVRTHADELGIDPDRIAAGGGSAGGQVAAATATVDGFNEDAEDTSVPCRPNALVLFNPVIDNGPDGYGYTRTKHYWKSFSPLHNIDQNTPPAIVFLGTDDRLVPVQTAKTFKKRMEDAGNRCDLDLYDGYGHGFFNEKKYHETLYEADKFLGSIGYLHGKPTLEK